MIANTRVVPAHHHLRPMGGRDVDEAHRAATPLELLFDLTFVVAFGFAANHTAHAFAEAHFATALLGFGFASFAICWAWVNFSWFASAYDTDDWIFRVTTMVQMFGVLVLALGLPRMFASLEDADGYVDNRLMVVGYVIMRVALVAQWLRAARQDPARRRACLTYVASTLAAQAGWVALLLSGASGPAVGALILLLAAVELSGPWFAERRDGGTPWHAHHIVERYALFATIALGEGIIGTVASLSAAVETQGWTTDAALVGIAGLGLTFGLWWIYHIPPSARVLHTQRRRSFVWGYSQMFVVATLVASGAGLHVAALYIEHHAEVSGLVVTLSTAIPVALFVASIYALYGYLVQQFDPFHRWLLGGTAVLLAVAIGVAAAGVSVPVSLCLVALAPVVTIVGYEWRGHAHQVALLTEASPEDAPPPPAA